MDALGSVPIEELSGEERALEASRLCLGPGSEEDAERMGRLARLDPSLANAENLRLAALGSSGRMARALVAAGARAKGEVGPVGGASAAVLAAARGDPELVEALLSAGAEPEDFRLPDCSLGVEGSLRAMAAAARNRGATEDELEGFERCLEVLRKASEGRGGERPEELTASPP